MNEGIGLCSKHRKFTRGLDFGKSDAEIHLQALQSKYCVCVFPCRFFESWGRGVENLQCVKDKYSDVPIISK